MRILITNDDGMHADQLLPLIRWCQKLGEVTVFVPKVEQSGKSHSFEIRKPFEVKQVALAPDVTVWSVDSTPADCVRIAVLGLKMEFDLVISGINRGLNIGADIMYSGTVAAASEAVNLGIPAVALSTTWANYPTATEKLDEILSRRRQKFAKVLIVIEGAYSMDGDIAPVRAAVKEQMLAASAACNFEKAARLRDVYDNIEAVFGRKNRIFENPSLPDQKIPPGVAAINSLARRLGLPKPPETVICFDISNILGTLAVASMVTFTNGKADRQAYRRFRIKTVMQSDDFAMMNEAITRHFSRLLKEKRPLPDLLVVDGGKGQLSAALDALVAIKCPPLPVIGLAKRFEEIYLPGRSEPVVLDRHDAALRMLQALRDEAHRFAITYHRSLREKRINSSLLDEIPGIGEVRKRQLLKAFGSVRNLAKADANIIALRIPGIGQNTAKKILEILNR